MSNCVLVKIRFYTWAIWVKKHLIIATLNGHIYNKDKIPTRKPFTLWQCHFLGKKKSKQGTLRGNRGRQSFGERSTGFLNLKTWERWSFPGGSTGKEPTCQCKRCKGCRFNPWVRKIAWRKAWQPTPVFLPGESPWTEESGWLQSTGSQRVRHNWSELACMDTTQLRCWKWMSTFFKLIRSFIAFPVNPVSFQCFLFFPPKYGCK